MKTAFLLTRSGYEPPIHASGRPVITAALMLLLLISETSMMGQSLRFLPAAKIGEISNPEMNEISGIASGRTNADVLWAHKDSGGQANIMAFTKNGTHLATYLLRGARHDDWEDMAIGPGPDPKTNYLYIIDSGNNKGLTNKTCTIYRLAEPKIKAQQGFTVALDMVSTLPVKYPDALRHDCETLLSDPVSGDLFLCTRDRWNDDKGCMKVYRYPASDQVDDKLFTLLHVADVPLTCKTVGSKKSDRQMAVGGDISADGSFVLIRTTSKRKNGPKRVLLWGRTDGSDLWDCFQQPPCEMPAADEPQGEAICFAADGSGYYTISEGVCPPIYYFAREMTDGQK